MRRAARPHNVARIAMPYLVVPSISWYAYARAIAKAFARAIFKAFPRALAKGLEKAFVRVIANEGDCKGACKFNR